MANLMMMRQEIDYLRKSLHTAFKEKEELCQLLCNKQEDVYEREKFIAEQLSNIIRVIEKNIEQTVMETNCFVFRKKRLKKKLSLLCQLRNQLKTIYADGLTLSNSKNQQEIVKSNTISNHMIAMATNSSKSYYC
nr:uncharacterized protein LOC101239451 [Hydra vulgaris]